MLAVLEGALLVRAHRNPQGLRHVLAEGPAGVEREQGEVRGRAGSHGRHTPSGSPPASISAASEGWRRARYQPIATPARTFAPTIETQVGPPPGPAG